MTKSNEPIAPIYDSEGRLQTDPDREHLIGMGAIIGLTKREYFAGIALQGFINTGCVRNQTLFTKIKRFFGFFGGQTNNSYSYPAIVKSSVEIADLLIEELNK